MTNHENKETKGDIASKEILDLLKKIKELTISLKDKLKNLDS